MKNTKQQSVHVFGMKLEPDELFTQKDINSLSDTLEHSPVDNSVAHTPQQQVWNELEAALLERDRLKAINEELLEALEAATERMEAVANKIPIDCRSKGVSPSRHVAHMAGHLMQHAIRARAAIAKAKGLK